MKTRFKDSWQQLTSEELAQAKTITEANDAERASQIITQPKAFSDASFPSPFSNINLTKTEL
jgi:hypothetical protein